MVRVFFTIGLLLALQAAAAQSGSGLRLLRSYPAPVADATLDNLGNLYLVSENGQVKKYGPGGDSISVYNSVQRNGKLQTLDVSNPLRPLLFYRDYGQVVLLDRLLAVQATLDLRRQGITQPLAAAMSFDNKVWVFDGVTNQLKKLDDAGKVLLETPDLRQVFAGGVQPQQIIDHNGWVYLADSAQGLFAFDYFGSFKRKIPVAGWRHLQVTDSVVLGISEGGFHTYNLATLMQATQPLPPILQDCAPIRWSEKGWLAICGGVVKLFSATP
ncbi:hypothetical protein [Paracnuella aquatica]|uniref:hypothetical protein n=1 Tax=Paracnuella aquatica TaxID=2268757 RepID=UPI000DEF56FA|nr:hypothetical protein [Paracnuella aquatica]RPD48174.1 hypothetical protein DRJ53_10530 [Paracnuella aquatica]